jgi:C1A family cysteine protease
VLTKSPGANAFKALSLLLRAQAYEAIQATTISIRTLKPALQTLVWVLHNYGAPDEGDWKYDISKFTQHPPVITDAHTKYNKDASNIGTEEIKPGDINTVKLSLSQGYPVLMGFTVYDSFESDVVANTGYVLMPNMNKEEILGGHATAILGHDDHDKTGGYSGHFWVANSWGTEWGVALHGQRGFFKVPYEFIANTDLISELWRVANASLSDISIKK